MNERNDTEFIQNKIGKKKSKILGGGNDQRNMMVNYSVVGVIKRQRRNGRIGGSVTVGMD